METSNLDIDEDPLKTPNEVNSNEICEKEERNVDVKEHSWKE